MTASRSNERFLPGITFPESLKIASSADMASIAGFEHYLVVVPSHAFRQTLENLYSARAKANMPSEPQSIIWGTKGFDPESGNLLSEVTREVFGENIAPALITGPSFAKETAKGLPTALVLACEQTEEGEKLAEWFRSPSTRVYPNKDLTGAQIGGAVKNVMAIAAGMGDGLGFGYNARAALITRGLAEIARLGAALGGQPETFMGLTGAGDLILTCTGDLSRNRLVGLQLAKNKPLDTILMELGHVAEGVHSAREVLALAQALDIDMPITRAVRHILYDDTPAAAAVEELLNRALKPEHAN
ncbi:MAG TPA: glycerol-3-phosphate dehydrogenase [Betaproteobacteria bacterium]|nr:glycerol-3-phosphate dehydrogenase [Betaproteobacteria bacterium]